MAKIRSPSTTKPPRRVSAHHSAPKSMIEKSKKTSFPAPTTIKTTTGTKTLAPATIVPLQPDSSSPCSDNRVTMLKSRFAGTILTAQRQLFENRTRCIVKEPTTEELRRVARKATNRTRCVVKKPTTQELRRAAREATNGPRCVVKKPTTEELRRAAREALEKVEQSVELDDSHKSVKDLERLCGWPIPYVGGFQNRMHYYGLYLKK